MKLSTASILFALVFCCCCLPTVKARCWIECSESQRGLSEPKCFLKDDGISTSCKSSISKSDLSRQSIDGFKHISLLIEFSARVSTLIIMNGIGNKLIVDTFVQHNEIRHMRLNGGHLSIRPELFYLLPNLKRLFLTSVKFQYFPYFSHSNRFLTEIFIHSFSCQDFHEKILRKGRVSDLPHLTYLSLTPEQPTNITQLAFSGLTSLSYLVLERLYISNPELTFRPLVRLKDLSFISAGLTDISFLKRTPSLSQLYLLSFYNNYIVSIHTDTFSRYSSLRSLNLDSNKISRLEDGCFNGLNKLTWLVLFSNSLSQLNTSSLKGLISLSGIDLGDNWISHLSSRMFEYLPRLNQVYVTSLPLHCNCNLQWLSIVDLDIYNSHCSSPPQLSGKFAIDPSIYVNCTQKLSYQCFNRSVSCPSGSHCEDTLDRYTCVCEEENKFFVQSLNKCISYRHKANIPLHYSTSCPALPTCSTSICPYCNCAP